MNRDPGAYLPFLPAIYSSPANPFLSGFLGIFQKLLTGLDDTQLDDRKGIQELLAAAVIGNLFYARFSFLFPGDDTAIPPISGAGKTQEEEILTRFNTYIGIEAPPDTAADPLAPFTAWLQGLLGWLAGWVDLVVETDWSIDKKRTVIAQIIALYRALGTPQGMGWLVDLWLDLPLTINGEPEPNPDDPDNPTAVTGTITVTIANPETPAIVLTDDSTAAQTFILRERAVPGMPLVSGYAPWLFLVDIVLPNAADPDFILTAANAAQIQTLQRQLRVLLDRFMPAGSHYRLGLVPGMQLRPDGKASQLGRNSFLGQGIAT